MNLLSAILIFLLAFCQPSNAGFSYQLYSRNLDPLSHNDGSGLTNLQAAGVSGVAVTNGQLIAATNNFMATATNIAQAFGGNATNAINNNNGVGTNLTVYGALISTNMLNSMTNIAVANGGGIAGWSTNVSAVNVSCTNTTGDWAYLTNVIISFTPNVSGNFSVQGWMNCSRSNFNYNPFFCAIVTATDEKGATNYFSALTETASYGFISYQEPFHAFNYGSVEVETDGNAYFMLPCSFYATANKPIVVTLYFYTQNTGWFNYDYWFKLSSL